MARQLSDAAIVSKEIRKQLKTKGIPARVRSENFAGGNSVDVFIEDAAPERLAEVKAIVEPFQYGRFDGMQDLYEYTNTRKDLPAQVKYVMIHNQLSDAMRQRIYTYVREYFSDGDKLPVTYAEGQNIRFMDAWVSDVVYRQFAQADSGWWESVAKDIAFFAEHPAD